MTLLLAVRSQDVETDVELIREHAQTIGLELNPSKCEIIGECSVSNDSVCHDFVRVSWEDAELLGSHYHEVTNKTLL